MVCFTDFNGHLYLKIRKWKNYLQSDFFFARTVPFSKFIRYHFGDQAVVIDFSLVIKLEFSLVPPQVLLSNYSNTLGQSFCL